MEARPPRSPLPIYIHKASVAFSLYYNHFGGPKHQSLGSNCGTPQSTWTKFGTGSRGDDVQKILGATGPLGAKWGLGWVLCNQMTLWHFVNLPMVITCESMSPQNETLITQLYLCSCINFYCILTILMILCCFKDNPTVSALTKTTLGCSKK